MRFITKQIINSNQFYTLFSSFVLYEEFVEFLAVLNDIKKTNRNICNSGSSFYSEHIKKNFNLNILFGEELGKIILNEQCEVKPIDKTIYKSILDYTKKFLDFEKNYIGK